MKAKERITAARAALVLDHPFFGALVLRLRLVEDPGCKTLWTEGERLGYNPDYVMSLSPSRLQAALAHEVLHCAGGHPWRRGCRDRGLWNQAADYAINHVLKDADFDVGEDWLLNPSFNGLSAEEIYDILADQPSGGGGSGSRGMGNAQAQGDAQSGGPPKEKENDGQGGTDGEEPGEGDPKADDGPEDFGPGEVRDAPQDKASQSEAEWRVAVAAAAKAAKVMGRLPGNLERFVEEAVEPRIDWRQILRRFVQSAAREDYSWKTPNPRYAPLGMYLPSLRSETMGPIVVFVDTSGSIGDAELSAFSAEIRSIAEEARPETLWVVYADADVHRADEFPMGEGVEINPIGGGGTDFRPAFEWVEKNALSPSCAVYLTDMHGRFPDAPPEYPVLWVATTEVKAPWGETVRLRI